MGEGRSSKQLEGEIRRRWLIEGGIVVRNQEVSGGAAFGWVLSGRPKPGSSAELQVFGRGRDKEEERASETETPARQRHQQRERESVSEHGLGVVWCGACWALLCCAALCVGAKEPRR